MGIAITIHVYISLLIFKYLPFSLADGWVGGLVQIWTIKPCTCKCSGYPTLRTCGLACVKEYTRLGIWVPRANYLWTRTHPLPSTLINLPLSPSSTRYGTVLKADKQMSGGNVFVVFAAIVVSIMSFGMTAACVKAFSSAQVGVTGFVSEGTVYSYHDQACCLHVRAVQVSIL